MFEMIGNYDDRKVDRWDNDDNTKMISTCKVTDGRKVYETAVEHPAYNDGKMVIVDCYDTKEQAQAGHDKWFKLMITNKLPNALVDCQNSDISQMCDMVGCDMIFERQN